MKPKFRVIQRHKGWNVEYATTERNLLSRFLFGVEKYNWKPYITYLGSDEAYPYSTKENALIFGLKQLRNHDIEIIK